MVAWSCWNPRSILFLFIIGSCFVLQAQDLTLPVYRLTIDTLDLAALNGNPWLQRTFPAIIETEGEAYSCQVRYRGATARNLPKKSWKIVFDQQGPGGQSETNLNSEYRDLSFSRNHFVLEMCRFAGIPTPASEHVSLFVNDRYMGVYLEIEQVDELFIERYNLGYGALWKGLLSGARFAPFTEYEDTFINYEPKIMTAGAIDTLGTRCACLQFSDPGDMRDILRELVDVEEVLTYFAVQFVMNNHDGFTKNIFIHEGWDARWRIFPWDCDASIGNNWEGNWIDLHDSRDFLVKYQSIFQRLIGVPEYRERLHEIIEYLITDGYGHIVPFINATFNRIRNDVSFDPEKRGSNEQFDAERVRILEWLENRMDSLENLDWFHRVEAERVTIEPEYISHPREPFRIMVELPRQVHMVTTWVIDGNEVVTPYDCYDDGSHGDTNANDFIYTRELILADSPPPYSVGFFIHPNAEEKYPIPSSSWILHEYFPTPLPVVRLDEAPPAQGDFTFTEMYRIPASSIHYFGLINTTDHPVDVSGCMVRLGDGYKRMQIRELEPVQPNDTLIITNNVELLLNRFRGCTVVGGFFFQPETGDEVSLTTYGGRKIASAGVGNIHNVCELSGPVVINEINYHSSDEFDPGDWIELYNLGEDMNIGGWTVKDSREDHFYSFHEGAIIHSGEYIIVAADIEAFRESFPDAAPVYYNLGFGLGAGGDYVRLFDNVGRMVDFVNYDDDNPWPPEADGDGATLELVNPREPNYGPDNWHASNNNAPNGTPGLINSTYLTVRHEPDMPTEYGLVSVYPNPFNSAVRVVWNQPFNKRTQLTVYDILGRRIDRLCDRSYPAGQHYLTWRPDNLSAGIYLLSFEQPNLTEVRQVIYLK